MQRRQTYLPRLLAAAAAVLLAAAAATLVRADDHESGAILGDTVHGEIGAGEVLAYRVALVAGTELDVRLEAEAGGEEDDDRELPGKDEPAAPSLALLAPDGATLAIDDSARPRIRRTATATGEHTVEVRAGTFAGSFTLEIEGELPRSVDGRIVLAGGEGELRLDAPLGASVRIDVRRRSGDAPRLVAVRDAAGREIGFSLRKASRKRLRTHDVPVTAPGGLTVVLAGNGTYDVRGRLSDDDDDLPEGDDDREERRIVVTLAPGTDPVALAAELGYRLVEVEDGYAVLETPEGREGFEDDDARDADDRFEEILGAEVDARLQTPEGLQSNGVILGSSLERPQFENQAALQDIKATKAQRRASGAGVVVAVLDTGIDAAHPLFAERLGPGIDLVDGDDDPTELGNGLDDDGDGEIDEGFGHGTFVAGLVLAVAPDATILPVRVLDTDAVGSVSRVAAGIRFAIDNGADVINLSLGARVRSEILRGEIRRAQSRGIVVVAAAGNRADPAQIDFPAGLADVVAVTSLDAGGGRAGFANGSARTTVAAPGTDLIGPYPGGEYARWSGTSFSAALVSGGVGLLEERRPSFRVPQVVKRLRRTARGLPRRLPAARRQGVGGGVLNLARLVR